MVKSGNFILAVGFTILAVIVVGASLVYVFTRSDGVAPVAEGGNTAPPLREVQYSDSGAITTGPLVAKTGIVLKDVSLCKPSDQPNFVYSFGYVDYCLADSCMSVLNFNGQPAPQNLTIYRLVNGTCIRQDLTDIPGYLATYEYEAEITITPDMQEKLSLTAQDLAQPMKAPTSQFSSITARQVDGRTVVSLIYPEQPTEDLFIIGNKTVLVRFGQPTVVERAPQPVVPAMPTAEGATSGPANGQSGFIGGQPQVLPDPIDESQLHRIPPEQVPAALNIQPADTQTSTQ